MTVSMLQIILVALVNAVCKMESSWMGECKLRQPIVTGCLVGLVLGNVEQGLKIGAALELAYMGVTGIGPASSIDVTTAGTIGTFAGLVFGEAADVAVAFAIPAGLLMQFVGAITQSAWTVFNSATDKEIANRNWKGISKWMFIGALGYVACDFIITFLACNAIAAASNVVDVSNMPAWVNGGLSGASALLASLGFATLLAIMMDTELIPFFMIGFVFAAYGGAPNTMVGVGALGLALALIMNLLLNKIGNGGSAKDEWED